MISIDQSICGSCWSFGTTGTIEGAYFLKHGERKSFSEQVFILAIIILLNFNFYIQGVWLMRNNT